MPELITQSAVSERTQWHPVNRSGIKEGPGLRRLVIVSDRVARFAPSYFFRGLLVAGFALGLTIIITTLINFKEKIDDPFWWLMLVGFVFCAICGLMLYNLGIPIQFDKSSGYFWHGRFDPVTTQPTPKKGYKVRLSDIEALQLIAYTNTDSDGDSHTVYQLNLVQTDSNRRYLSHHHNRRKIVRQANDLADWLGKPIWSALPA